MSNLLTAGLVEGDAITLFTLNSPKIPKWLPSLRKAQVARHIVMKELLASAPVQVPRPPSETKGKRRDSVILPGRPDLLKWLCLLKNVVRWGGVGELPKMVG